MSIKLNLNQARQLLDFFGGEDAQVTVSDTALNMHSGPGLYAWLTEHPDEGSIKLDEEDRPNDEHDDLTPGADSTDRAGVTGTRHQTFPPSPTDDPSPPRNEQGGGI